MKKNDNCPASCLAIKGHAGGGYTVRGHGILLDAGKASVNLSGETGPSLDFQPLERAGHKVGPMEGTIVREKAVTGGAEIRRELFAAADGKNVAVRFIVKNTGSSPLCLREIRPLEITGDSSLLVAGGGLPAWRVLRYPSHKSDIPSSFRPARRDKDYQDAVFSCMNAIPGQGVIYNVLNSDSLTVNAGTALIIRNEQEPAAPALMMCTLGLKRHFFEMEMTIAPGRDALESFIIRCNFDGVTVNPGAETGTDWLMFSAGEYEGELLGRFAETAALNHEPPLSRPRKPSPTVYCTWYFYTFNISERYVNEELAEIKRLGLPIDVFQVDDGWMDSYGNYEADPEKFPGGMAATAERIRAAGMTPGIWSAPFVVDSESPVLKRYPDMALLDEKGEPLIFDTTTNFCYIVDPSAPGGSEFLEETFRKFREWGYRYHKLDWLRALYGFENARFRDPGLNRVSAYSKALEIIRRAVGEDSYILACGGMSDHGNHHFADGQRTSKDVRGCWDGPEDVPMSGALIQIKQNLLRNYINRFYDTDPDASQVRLRDRPFFQKERKCVGVFQSEGRYTDEEAFTVCAHQYLAGGMITISERFPELQPHRLALLRHISPAFTPPAAILDYGTPVCPTLFLTGIEPRCRELGSWWTLAVANWGDSPERRTICPAEFLPAGARGSRLAVFEFREQKYHGLVRGREEIALDIPAHGIRVLRLAPWDGSSPLVLGTDLHLSGGGCELAGCRFSEREVSGRVETRWPCETTVTVGFPDKEGNLVPVKALSPFRGGPFAAVRPAG